MGGGESWGESWKKCAWLLSRCDAQTKEGLRDRRIDETNEEEAAARVAPTETATKTVASPLAAGF